MIECTCFVNELIGIEMVDGECLELLNCYKGQSESKLTRHE
jgi:hypothetical protein